ncbi:MAG: hypothetical protein ACYCX5_12570 [Coriobacteriia bacterium]
MTKSTATIELNPGFDRLFFQPNESTVLEQLRLILPQYSILSVSRSLGSGRFTVSLDSGSASHEQITYDFLRAMRDMDYNGEVIAVDGGSISSAPGGIVEAVTGTVQQTANAAGSFLVPAAVIAVAVIVILYFPKPRS